MPELVRRIPDKIYLAAWDTDRLEPHVSREDRFAAHILCSEHVEMVVETSPKHDLDVAAAEVDRALVEALLTVFAIVSYARLWFAVVVALLRLGSLAC